MTSDESSHDPQQVRMVDVSQKPVTVRKARATGRLKLRAETLAMIRQGRIPKGNVIEAARLAGIMAAKRTPDLLPLCHPLPLSAVEVAFDFPDETTITIEAMVRAAGQTGVEMEALVAVSIAALTIYDMCKTVDREVVIEQIRLEEKSGGRSGHFVRAN